MDQTVIIVAGGSGNRLGKETPKQFLPLAGLPVLMHSVHCFYRFNRNIRIYLVIHPGYHDYWQQLCTKYSFHIPHTVVPGGETRFHSVKNGLNRILGEGWVAIHDAARPLVTEALIERCFREAEMHGNAIPAIPVNETVRWVEDGKVSLVDRSLLRITQTPQVFRLQQLKDAYEQDFQPGFTDDASLLEALGQQIHLVEGDPENMKITLPADLSVAETLLQRRDHPSLP